MKTTHIGSLPFTKLEQALDYTFSFDLPVLFTLPKNEDSFFMLEELCYLITGKNQIEKLQLNIQKIPFIDAFFKKSNGLFKYQLCGPITFYESCLKGQGFLRKDFYQFYQEGILKVVEGFGKELQNLVFFIDEPELTKADRESFLFLDALCLELKKEFNIQVGLHSCATLNEDKISLEKFDYLNIDACINSEKLVTSVNSIGIDLNTKVNKEFELITPRCGLALKSDEYCYQIKNYLDRCRDKYSHL